MAKIITTITTVYDTETKEVTKYTDVVERLEDDKPIDNPFMTKLISQIQGGVE